MAIDRDVLLALLALDSYNRHGTASKRKFSDDDGNELDSQIGTVQFNRSSDRMETPVNGFSDPNFLGTSASLAGFSASEYSLGGETIISYRGTDFGLNWEFAKDLGAGWLSSFNAFGPGGFAVAGVPLVSYQPFYAQQFYEVVTGNKVFPTLDEGGQTGGATLVGHSLGGALAGYVGALTDDETRLFNEIPYIGMSMNTALDTFIKQNIGNGVIALVTALGQLAQGQPIDVEGHTFSPLNLPDNQNIYAYRMLGEVAMLGRDLGPYAGFAFSLFVGQRVGALKKALSKNLGIDENAALQTIEAAGKLDEFISIISQIYGITAPDSNYETVFPFTDFSLSISKMASLHSQALMVIDLFGDTERLYGWESVGEERFRALFNSDLADKVGADEFGGYGASAEKMMFAIAYSSLDEGNKLFGDTGIRSMYNDIIELGKVFDDDSNLHPFLESSINDGIFFDTSLKQNLTNFAVSFAGALALNKVEHDQNGEVDAREGVFTLNDDETVLALDLSTVLWRDLLGKRVFPFQDLAFQTEYFTQIRDASFRPLNLEEALELLATLSQTVWNGRDFTNFDRFHMPTQPDLAVVDLADRSYDITTVEGPMCTSTSTSVWRTRKTRSTTPPEMTWCLAAPRTTRSIPQAVAIISNPVAGSIRSLMSPNRI